MTSDQGGNRFGNRSEQVPTPDGNSWGCIGGNSPLAQADDDLLATFGYHRPSWQLDALCRRVPQPAVASVERPANRAGAAGLRTLRHTRRVASPGRWPTRHCSACSVAPATKPDATGASSTPRGRRERREIRVRDVRWEGRDYRARHPGGPPYRRGRRSMTPVSLSPRLHLASVFSPGLHAPPAPTLQPGGRRFPTPSRLAVCTSLGLSDPPPLGLFIGDHKPPDSVSSRSVYESGTFRPSTPGGVGVFPLGSWRQDTAIRILPPTPRGVHEPARVGGNPMTGVCGPARAVAIRPTPTPAA